MSGSLPHPVSRIIQQLLIDLGHVTDPSGLYAANASTWPAFVGSMADKPDNCIVIHDTEGVMEGRTFVAPMLFQKHGLQVRARANGPSDGYIKLNTIFQALVSITRQDVIVPVVGGGTATITYSVQSVQHRQPIIRMGAESGSHRYQHSFNSTVSVRIKL